MRCRVGPARGSERRRPCDEAAVRHARQPATCCSTWRGGSRHRSTCHGRDTARRYRRRWRRSAKRPGPPRRRRADGGVTCPGTSPRSRRPRIRSRRPCDTHRPRSRATRTEYPFHFQPYASASFLDGSLAHLPWMQELPDPMTSAMWSSWIELNPRTAENLGVSLHDVVEVASSVGTVRAPAFINPALAPDVVAMPVGRDTPRSRATRRDAGAARCRFSRRWSTPKPARSPGPRRGSRSTRVGDPDGKLILFRHAASCGGENPHEGETR